MGRAKLKLAYETNDKKRRQFYASRKEALFKKMHEFTTLCGVKGGAIIYDGSFESPEIWPPNGDDVRELVENYKAAKDKGQYVSTYSVSDFYKGEKQKIEEELAALRKENVQAKYPSWVEPLNELSRPELGEFAAKLGNKLSAVKSRIEELKKESAARSDLSETQTTMMNEQQGVLPNRPLQMLPDGYGYSQNEQLHSATTSSNVLSTMVMPMLMTGGNSDQVLYKSVSGHGIAEPTGYDSLGNKVQVDKARIDELKKGKSDVMGDPNVNQSDWSQTELRLAPYGHSYSSAVEQHNQLHFVTRMNQPSLMDLLRNDNASVSDQSLSELTLGNRFVQPTVYDTSGPIVPNSNWMTSLQSRPSTCYAQPIVLLQLLPRE